MSCDCAQCRQHYKTLGFMFGVPSESEIQEAYKEGVKQWHPDLYENYASLRADAEERFKQLQVAYRELGEHNRISAAAPAERVADRPPSSATQPQAAPQPQEDTPSISFGGATGCQTAPFTEEVQEMIAPHLGKLGPALAIVDLSGSYSQFFLLAAKGIMARDARNMFSLLWYADLGEISLIDRRGGGKLGSWQKLVGGISGSQTNLELQINRSNGTNFFSISGKANDSVKTAIYDFLLLQKLQAHP